MNEYSRMAKWYDTLVGPSLRPVHESMVQVALKRGCRSAVDVCCGTGMLAGMCFEAGLPVIGLDLSPDMLAVARKKRSGVRFQQGDATRLPFASDGFDAGFISFALHEKPLDQAERIFAETLRIVRPGGVVLIGDYRLPSVGRSPMTGLVVAMVERLAGADHHACFRQYMDRGGTTSFLHRSGEPFVRKRVFMGGWAGVYAVTVE
ncbi:Methyltransferase type 11 [Pseudodesulfovibrio profundus]|uniref:Methyltransferase type 11 n=1 Tax=Pseudodesulfovibrio profundus TaxID=57320 RepID=A0A2C8F9E7_9BACT|nr:class I SAM-dependent methyltransferase [Pseudodesulfovibrio profundus]SOB58500.1 Methyltransferase type 11 [Pseudodesulfovibrio profundus]